MNNTDLVNEIRSKVDIVDIISEKLPLISKGKNFFGVCPFHDDTNPSMSVSREKQIYRCFSCGASGNVFTFLMDYEHKEFKEVLKELGDRVGVSTSNIKVKSVNKKYDKLYDAYNLSVRYFQNNLVSSIGRGAREYLKKRKLDDKIIKEYNIGLSLDKYDDLTKLLINKGYDLKTLNEIGLSIDDRDIYNDRIMFPLHDTYGHIVGFSGRIYKNIDQSKYVNTKETKIFVKGHCLYNYHIAKDAVRTSKKLIIMEGFMDVIRAGTIGYKNVVALMGTALTKEQINLIKRLTNNVVLCLDGDEAGKNAADKIGNLLNEEKLDVKIITLPNDDDPDTYILNNTKESFDALVSNAINYSEYRINKLKENVNFQSDEELSEYINDVLLETVKIDDEIRVEIILKKLAKDYNIGYNTLGKRFNALKKEIKPKQKKENIKPTRKIRTNKYIIAMNEVIYYMLNNDWVVDLVDKENLIYPSNETRLLTSEIIYYYRKNGTINIADFYTYLQEKDELLKLLNEINLGNYKENVTKDDLFSHFKVIRDYSKVMQIKILEDKMKKEIDPIKQSKISEEIRKLRLGE